MLVEVIFYDRVVPYRKGGIALLEDGVFLRAILKGGKAEVLNPPDWSPEKADAEEAAALSFVPEPVIPIVPEPIIPIIKEEVKLSGNSKNISGTWVANETSQPKVGPKGYGKKSQQRSEGDAANGS